MGELGEEIRATIAASGYVVVKAATYRRLQERVRIAESQRDWEVEVSEHTRRWAMRAFDEQARLAARLTFVYGEARAAGCSIEQLAGPNVEVPR